MYHHSVNYTGVQSPEKIHTSILVLFYALPYTFQFSGMLLNIYLMNCESIFFFQQFIKREVIYLYTKRRAVSCSLTMQLSKVR